jgi:hypothetical protein
MGMCMGRVLFIIIILLFILIHPSSLSISVQSSEFAFLNILANPLTHSDGPIFFPHFSAASSPFHLPYQMLFIPSILFVHNPPSIHPPNVQQLTHTSQ